MVSRFVFNETSYLGWGAREVLVDEINKRKYKKALFVTDDSLLKIGIANKVLDLLNDAQIDYELFSDIKPNPTIANVRKGLRICKKYHCDYIIAVGGGSVIDTAKAIGIVMTNPEYKDISSLNGVALTSNPSLPIIALPTTHGTAAECTINYVITNEDDKVKMVCVDPHSIPVLAIIDSELMSGMPSTVAAATGMDALTHAIECYITKAHNEMSDMFALKAIGLIYKNLEKAVNKDKNAIEQMALAQYIAGMGFSNVGLGVVHSMAHQLGALYDTPHGLANALLLPYVLEWNGEICPERFVEMGNAMGIDMDGLEGMDAVRRVSQSVKNLAIRLDIPRTIKDIDGKEDDVQILAQKAFNDPCLGGNPREVSLSDLEDLFRSAF